MNPEFDGEEQLMEQAFLPGLPMWYGGAPGSHMEARHGVLGFAARPRLLFTPPVAAYNT